MELLRERVGSPLLLASLARDFAVGPATLKRYLDILQALFIVFVVRSVAHNITRAILQSLNVYFFDNGLVKGDQRVVLENPVAVCYSSMCIFFRTVWENLPVCIVFAQKTAPRRISDSVKADAWSG